MQNFLWKVINCKFYTLLKLSLVKNKSTSIFYLKKIILLLFKYIYNILFILKYISIINWINPLKNKQNTLHILNQFYFAIIFKILAYFLLIYHRNLQIINLNIQIIWNSRLNIQNNIRYFHIVIYLKRNLSPIPYYQIHLQLSARNWRHWHRNCHKRIKSYWNFTTSWAY